MLPNDCKQNFIVCFTNTINPAVIPAMPVLKKLGILDDKYIFFENDCLVPSDLLDFKDNEEKKGYVLTAENNWRNNKK